MAVALTLGLIAWIEKPDAYGFDDLLLLVVQQLGLGLLVGVGMGLLASRIFARLPHAIGAFAPVASVAVAALSFGVADVIGGSGFLAVYLVGLAVGSTPSRYRRHLVAFHEGLAFLAQVALFIVLGLLVFPSRASGGRGCRASRSALLLVFVCRPVAVWASTWFSDFTSRERLLLGWAGLRGAVPIVLATFVLSSDVPGGGHHLRRRLLRRRRLDDPAGNDAGVARRATRPCLAEHLSLPRRRSRSATSASSS